MFAKIIQASVLIKLIIFLTLLSHFLIPCNIKAQSSNAKLLEKAYKIKSKEKLEEFFINWSKEINSISDNEFLYLNDTLKHVYKAFSAFYRPFDIKSLGGSEWGNDIYKDKKYFIVQNKIQVYLAPKVYYTEQEIYDYVVDGLNKKVKAGSTRQKFLRYLNGKNPSDVISLFGPNREFYKSRKRIDSIVDFRPNIESNEFIPLYLSPKYDALLNSFLGNKHLPLGFGNIMNPARSVGQSKKRKKFLENYIRIWYGHWGGYWQLLSYPEAYSITFDNEMQYAIVNFRMVYEGGEAIMKRENNEWKLLSSKITWIE